MLTALIVLGVVVYTNIGLAIGLHIHKKPKCNLSDSPAPLVGVIWPVLLGGGPTILILKYLKARREKNAKALEAKEATKALPPPSNDPVSEARELTGLQEKVERMKRELEELSEEIGRRKADPQVVKAAKLLNRF